jgi:hypothetical protein
MKGEERGDSKDDTLILEAFMKRTHGAGGRLQQEFQVIERSQKVFIVGKTMYTPKNSLKTRACSSLKGALFYHTSGFPDSTRRWV